MRQASVANLRALQPQLLQAREPLERCQAGVADLRTRKFQDSEVGQALQVDQPRIGHRRAIQRQELKAQSALRGEPARHP